MEKISKKDVRVIAAQSDWSSQNIKQFLSQNIYPNTKQWFTFFERATLVLGVGLFVIGVVFFFAYNWESLHKFSKLSLIFSLLIALTIPQFISKISVIVKQITLTAACLVLGVLFAVYGQIYQTGANAYDFFLAWAVFSFLWVITANFKPLWLLYILLLNVTLFFYFEQTQAPTSYNLENNLFYFIILNSIPVVVEWYLAFSSQRKHPSYLTYVFLGINLLIATNILSFTIAGEHVLGWSILLSLWVLLDTAFSLFYYKNIFFAALLAVSTLSLLIAFIYAFVEMNIGIFLIITLVVIAYITLSVVAIMALQKKWKNELN
ncbi:DUF2157 domain-containing protein [Flavobacterium agricola]|uniref:DUF2157 domain-containing protein n=1 Tax=Flavobacterium agricola TaxID=2870839 RepID=A0ABY6M1H8_9FLAO|nr:DUF2157 domain-containing protein [Flavobacterium agricola]UYW00728.1 DUF2157 domain-containing protein [Flavobacterium agricola]